MISISQFSKEYRKLADRNRDVVNAFKTVQTRTQTLSGGVGNLKPALDAVSERVKQTEEKRVEKIENAGQRFAMFLNNTLQTDKRVAQDIKVSNQEFYNVNPWAVPKKPKKWWQKVGDWFKKVGKKIGGAVKKAVTWVADKVKKAWDATVKFIKKHYKTILKIVGGAVLIAGLFALSVVTGGAAAGVFALAAKAAVTMALTSTATSVVSGIVQGKSAEEIFDSAGDSFFKGAITGAISGAVSAVGPAVLTATGSEFFAKGAEILAKGAGDFIGGMITEGTDYLCEHGTLSGFLSGYAKDAGLNVLKGMAGDAVGAVGGYLKNKGLDLLTDTFKGLGGGTLMKSFEKTIGDFSKKVPWLIGENGVFGSIGDLSKLSDPAGLAKELGSSWLGQAFGGKFDGVSDMITDGLTNISDALGLPDLVKSGVSDIASSIGSAMSGGDIYKSLGNKMIDLGKNAMNSLCGSGFAQSISDSMKSAFDLSKGLSNIQVGALSANLKEGSVTIDFSKMFR
ncbi:hypothetical protein SAMN02910447_02293 [Ruminococcus sp. YE71]|nr:hypothetical protein SAMN02910446_02160 [Ruminococcus sp. YE78]SFW39359.1 hypothetical protein SAMN02910447_02293 [Ruminococcus sp. YE71]